MIAWAIILLLGLTVGVFYYYIEISHLLKVQCLNFNKKKPPGEPAKRFILGNISIFHLPSADIMKKLRECATKYYPVYSVRVLYVTSYFILSAEDCELILSNPQHNEKSIIYLMFQHWIGTGLLTSKGNKWAARRKVLTPAFHFSILQQFLRVFNEETVKLVNTLKDNCHKPFINITPLTANFTLNTITETAMGTKLTSENARHVAYRKAVSDIGEILVYRLIHSWLVVPLFNFFRLGYYKEWRTVNTLHKFTNDVIAEREKNFEDIDLPTEEDEVYKGKKRLALLDLLLSAKKNNAIDNEGIREEVDTFMFEGHDTTAAALGFALMLLACNRDIQDKIVEEIREVLGDFRKNPSYNDLQEMRYLERSIKEVLRLYPSVHFISRKLGEDLRTKSGYHFSKGTLVHITIYDLHRNPEIYPDPEKFDPDRFLPENSKNRHPFAYLPFSAGPRNCIGQKYAMLELKTAICGILANFVLEPVDTPETIVLVAAPILRTKDSIRVKFVPRV